MIVILAAGGDPRMTIGRITVGGAGVTDLRQQPWLGFSSTNSDTCKRLCYALGPRPWAPAFAGVTMEAG